jgi:hypothetical protein
MNGPPCATCGQPLRWFPEHHGWGCDRCRSFTPAQPPAPAPAFAPAVGAVAPARAPGKSSGKALWIGLGGAAVAGGVVAVVLATRGGGGDGGGSGSRDGLVKATTAALASGDVDALVKLGDPLVMFDKLLACESGERDESMDPKRQAEKMREEHGEIAEKTKGMTIEVVEITESDDKAEVIEKGQKLGPRCTARVAMKGHNLDVKVKLRKGDAPPVESVLELEVLEAGGGWYLVDDIELDIPSSAVAEVAKLKDAMCACKDTACTDKVMKEFEAFAKDAADEKPSPEDTTILTRHVTDMMECQQKVAGARGVAEYAEVLRTMTSFKDRMCACADKACADAVQTDFMAWSTEQSKKPQTAAPDKAQMDQAIAISDAFGKCMATAYVADAGVGSGSAAAPPPPEPPPPTTTEPPPAAGFAVGDRVSAKWTNGKWYPGKIVKIHDDGRIDVDYDDGDKSKKLPPSKVRKKEKRSSSSSGRSSSSSGDSDAPCPGPGITRRCNGKCVNIQEDNNHCGGCNNRCPDGKTCDGHMFCRDAEGNL